MTAIQTIRSKEGLPRKTGESIFVLASSIWPPELGVSISLFQTGVPSFYEKLGGRLITNRIVNGDKRVLLPEK